ncbi:Transposase (putative), YhgA-like protein, partial [Candidatus Magnetobacterium bavaricum]
MDTTTGSGSYDKIMKELLDKIEQPLIEKVLGIKADEVSKLNVVMQLTDEREADFVLKVKNRGVPFFVAHAEIQSTNDPRMLKRMLRYFVHIYSLHEVIVKQYVVFIGKDKPAMNNVLDMPGIHYEYELIDIRDIPCERFLYNGVPQEIVLSVLCNRGDRDERSFAREILTELIASVSGGLDLSMYVRELEVFSKLRDMQEIIVEEVDKMPIVYDLETDIRFMQGVQ